MDAVAPGLLLAQAIGRLGNYFNQELFGKPTDLPGGLDIDPSFRPEGYARPHAFHPTFLYESLWNFRGSGPCSSDRHFKIRPPGSSASTSPLLVRAHRSGDAPGRPRRTSSSGKRLNFWVSLLLFVVASAAFVWLQFFRRRPAEGAAEARPGAKLA